MKYALLLLSVATSIVIFSQNATQNEITSATLPEKSVSMLAVGDIMLGRSVNTRSAQNGYDWPFRETHALLSESDITVGNLESPLALNCPLTNEGMIFCGDEKQIAGLKYAEIDIVNLANNHGIDQGTDGISDTKEILTNENINYIGSTEQPLIIEVGGISFGLLGYNTIFPESSDLAWGHKETVVNDISSLSESVNHVIVSFHWGNEYTNTITPLQNELAHAAIDAGADIVIGHHPHWVQKNELYKEKPIYYSLGNFVFDQMWSQKTREGLAIQVTFAENTMSQIKHFPIVIENYGQPRLANEKESATILEYSQIESFFD